MMESGSQTTGSGSQIILIVEDSDDDYMATVVSTIPFFRSQMAAS